MITLICGIPNAGKTTYSEQFENVFHLDDYIGRGNRYVECAREAAKIDGDVCVEGIYNTKHDREILLNICSNQDKKVCIWLDTDVNVCCNREKAYRQRGISLVRSHKSKFEPPTYMEGWDEIIRIKDNGEEVIMPKIFNNRNRYTNRNGR